MSSNNPSDMKHGVRVVSPVAENTEFHEQMKTALMASELGPHIQYVAFVGKKGKELQIILRLKQHQVSSYYKYNPVDKTLTLIPGIYGSIGPALSEAHQDILKSVLPSINTGGRRLQKKRKTRRRSSRRKYSRPSH